MFSQSSLSSLSFLFFLSFLSSLFSLSSLSSLPFLSSLSSLSFLSSLFLLFSLSSMSFFQCKMEMFSWPGAPCQWSEECWEEVWPETGLMWNILYLEIHSWHLYNYISWSCVTQLE